MSSDHGGGEQDPGALAEEGVGQTTLDAFANFRHHTEKLSRLASKGRRRRGRRPAALPPRQWRRGARRRRRPRRSGTTTPAQVLGPGHAVPCLAWHARGVDSRDIRGGGSHARRRGLRHWLRRRAHTHHGRPAPALSRVDRTELDEELVGMAVSHAETARRRVRVAWLAIHPRRRDGAGSQRGDRLYLLPDSFAISSRSFASF